MAKIIKDIMQEYMFCCDIISLYIESDIYFKFNKNNVLRGKEDKTTRLQIFFRISNNDIYSLRIDMPHKGVN